MHVGAEKLYQKTLCFRPFFQQRPQRKLSQRNDCSAAYERAELRWRGERIEGLLWRPRGITPNLNGSWRRIYPPHAGWTFAAVPAAHATGFCEMLVKERVSGYDEDHAIAIGARVVRAR